MHTAPDSGSLLAVMHRLKSNRGVAGVRPGRQCKWGIVVLLLGAALARFWGIGAKGLWLDEIMTVQKASMGYGEMLGAIREHDAHPPLYQSVEWLWLRLGRGDGFARVPSAAAGVAAVWLAYLLARRWFGRRAGLLAGALTGFSYFQVYYSQEARLYALVAPLALGQVYLLLRILHQRGRAHWGWWAGYGALALAGLYAYALCILTIGACALVYVGLTWRRRRWQLGRFVLVHVVVGLLFLPWYPTLRATTARVRASVAESHDEKPAPGAEDVLDGVAAWGMGPLPWTRMRPWGVALGGALLLLAGAGLLMRRGKRPAKTLAVLFFVPLVTYVLLPIPRVHVYDAKHLVFLQPALAIALAGFRLPAGRCGAYAGRAAVYVAALLIGMNVWFLGDYYGGGFEKENWRAVVRDVRGEWGEGDALVFNPELMGAAFAYYLPTEAERELAMGRAVLGAPLSPDVRDRQRLLYPGVPPLRLSGAVRRVWVIECRNHVTPRPLVYGVLGKAGFVCGEEDGRRYEGHLGYVQWRLFRRATEAGGGAQ